MKLFDASIGLEKDNLKIKNFSALNFCETAEREKLENKYFPLVKISDKFSRQNVSYQLSKKASIHSWLKYKEGFSADLVNILLKDFKVKKKGIVLDPFMGSGTTALVCQMNGINSIGFDIMPISKVAISAKSNVLKYDPKEISGLIADINSLVVPKEYSNELPSVTITKGAYPHETSIFLSYLTKWNAQSKYSDLSKNLVTLAILNSLELVSYTSKDGQFLGWDSRCPKVIEINKKRIEEGKKPLGEKKVPHEIQDPQKTVVFELKHMLNDILFIQKNGEKENGSFIKFEQKSSLIALPKMQKDYINAVITSPPYCNRYDYTRTYALELSYLGLNESDFKKMRQALLSCTVESKSKREFLKDYFTQIGREKDFVLYSSIIDNNPALKEVISALNKRRQNGDLNNNGIIKMVDGYFFELGLLFAELYRICKKGAHVAFVNDNVRYGGEVIPVDFISCSIAESFGFHIEKIYALKQQKGNSSQQMGKFGRVALRKSITIWSKK